MICLTVSKVNLTLPKTTDPPDITVINAAFTELATAVNALIDENSKQLTFVSNVNGIVTVNVEDTSTLSIKNTEQEEK